MYGVAADTGNFIADTVAPSVAISPIGEAASGFNISGTTADVEDRQNVTVNIVNSANAVVDSFTASVSAGVWLVNVTSAQATALGNGSYIATADVSDHAGNLAMSAKRPFTVTSPPSKGLYFNLIHALILTLFLYGASLPLCLLHASCS